MGNSFLINQRLFILLFSYFFIFCYATSFAKYENYASIVINTKDGEVLYSRNPDKIVHLASITKLMTLYIAFEALKAKRISFDDEIVISQNAASQPRSKIYLIPDKKYTFKELVFASAIFSANDATVAIAEELAGGVDDFVYLMNQKASELGLVQTRYSHSTGLPQYINTSTPKDMINLAARIRADFPEYYSIFGMEMFAINGKIYGNMNSLLGYFKGIDGLKTGFTNVAGYNLIATFKYKENNIIGAVFGLSTHQEREKHMREIMEYSIKKILYRNMVKDSKTNDMVFEYEKFLKDSKSEQKKHSLYIDIFENIISLNKHINRQNIDNDTEKPSILNSFLSEISVLGNSISHPVPIIDNNQDDLQPSENIFNTDIE